MSNIPASWTVTKIVELLSLNENGKPFQQGWSPQCESHPSKKGQWGVLKTTAIQQGEFWGHENKALPDHLEQRAHLEVKAGDILMTCAGPRNRCGVVCFVKETRPRLIMSGKMYRFIPNLDALSPKYLEAFIMSHDAQYAIDQMKTGINDSGLNLTHGRFAELSVPLAPLNEQRRIVAKIETLFSELDNGIEALKTAREQLKVYHQAVFKHAFEGKLTAKWREKNKDKFETPEQLLASIQQEREVRYQQQLEEWKAAVKAWETNGKRDKRPTKPRFQRDTGLPSDEELDTFTELPEGWMWVKLGQLVWSVKDGPHYSPKYSGSGIPFITGGNVRSTGIDFESAKFISPELHSELSVRCKPEKEDVLYTKGGTTGIARVNTYDFEFNVWVHVAVLKITKSLSPYYLQHALNSPKCYMQSQKYTHGVGNQDLGLTRMVNIILPLCSKAEQIEIVKLVEKMVSEFDEIEKIIEVELKKSETLRQSILKKAFSGQLVPQDPNDEPAAVLLERIRAEKAQVNAKPKPKLRKQPATKKSA